jgi:carboxypeptidase Taq
MNTALTKLKTQLAKIEDLKHVSALLMWDQATYLPQGGSEARARQISLVAGLLQQKQTSHELGKLIDDVTPLISQLAPEASDAALIRVAREDFDRETRLPATFTQRLYSHLSRSYDLWVKARPKGDFKAVQASLAHTLELSREYSEFFPGYVHPADPHIDLNDPGMTVAQIQPLFAALRTELVPLAQAIAKKPKPKSGFLNKKYPEAEQLAFGLQVAQDIGYDLTRGRQDKTHHPFMIKFSLGDVRITTRVNPNDLGDAFFSTIHEAGHALYEQGLDPTFEGSPLGHGVSAGIHESQSRLWENLVARSKPFWKHYLPKLKKRFPAQLKGISLDDFYRAINRVQPSLIRVDADEVTYNLHVMLRFDLELQMLTGKLAIKDLPDAWNERYKQDLGIAPPSARDGVMQDMHWFTGMIGGVFQGYTLGNIYSAQCFAAALKTHPKIPEQIAKGQFETLRKWLGKNIHQYGRRLTPQDIIQKSTGKPLSITDYMNYLRKKYRAIYALV